MNDNGKKHPRYAAITEHFMNHPIHDDLSPGAFLLHLHYLTLAPDGNHPDPKLRWKFRTKIDDLAKHKRVKRKVLDRYNKELQDHGYINRKQGGSIPGLQIEILINPNSNLDLALSLIDKAKGPAPDSSFITFRQSYSPGFVTFRLWLYHNMTKPEKSTILINLLNTNAWDSKNAINQPLKQGKQCIKQEHTKKGVKNPNKNTNTKTLKTAPKLDSSDVQVLKDHWRVEQLRIRNIETRIEAAHGTILKSILEGDDDNPPKGVDELKALITKYFYLDDDEIMKTTHPIGWFKYRINSLNRGIKTDPIIGPILKSEDTLRLESKDLMELIQKDLNNQDSKRLQEDLVLISDWETDYPEMPKVLSPELQIKINELLHPPFEAPPPPVETSIPPPVQKILDYSYGLNNGKKNKVIISKENVQTQRRKFKIALKKAFKTGDPASIIKSRDEILEFQVENPLIEKIITPDILRQIEDYLPKESWR